MLRNAQTTNQRNSQLAITVLNQRLQGRQTAAPYLSSQNWTSAIYALLSMKALQFRCNDLTNKIDEIFDYMRKKDILIATIQETKLSFNSRLHRNLKTINYTLGIIVRSGNTEITVVNIHYTVEQLDYISDIEGCNILGSTNRISSTLSPL